MRRNIVFSTLVVTGAAALAVIGMSAPASAGSNGAKTAFMYNSIPSPLKGNMASVGFQATQTSEFGDAITFSPTANHKLASVTVTLSSWGCQSGTWTGGDCMTTPGATFTEPITVNIYNAAGTTQLATQTQTFAIPFRPSANPAKCGPGGQWWDNSLKSCFNGLATTVTLTFPGVDLGTNSIVYGIAYPTSGYGLGAYGYGTACAATTAGCGYDSLNVAIEGVISIGSETTPGLLWMNSATAANYCDGGTTGTFRQDSPGFPGCWDGYVPAVQFKATS